MTKKMNEGSGVAVGGEGFKMLGKHREGCFCADHAAYGHPFIVNDGEDFSRRKDGSKGGSTMWHRFKCNDPECEAVAIVRWDVLAKFIVDGLAAKEQA